jgi:hypothetical protein
MFNKILLHVHNTSKGNREGKKITLPHSQAIFVSKLLRQIAKA